MAEAASELRKEEDDKVKLPQVSAESSQWILGRNREWGIAKNKGERCQSLWSESCFCDRSHQNERERTEPQNKRTENIFDFSFFFIFEKRFSIGWGGGGGVNARGGKGNRND
ncbi:hypothetical protein CEXT_285431 [Caerostris extrusa]|uniref:Uncharacterized protein n=1 Tax=Caerostris extrusa TaxID=172846 RepID=A0AAV4SSR0_CAEEX|nr:hypothetical protein CEXT_285431 [Caerostris extrusa]